MTDKICGNCRLFRTPDSLNDSDRGECQCFDFDPKPYYECPEPDEFEPKSDTDKLRNFLSDLQQVLKYHGAEICDRSVDRIDIYIGDDDYIYDTGVCGPITASTIENLLNQESE